PAGLDAQQVQPEPLGAAQNAAQQPLALDPARAHVGAGAGTDFGSAARAHLGPVGVAAQDALAQADSAADLGREPLSQTEGAWAPFRATAGALLGAAAGTEMSPGGG